MEKDVASPDTFLEPVYLNEKMVFELNRTGCPGGSISREDGFDGKTESVFTGGTGACRSAGAGARARA